MAEKEDTDRLETFTFSAFRNAVKDIINVGCFLTFSICLEYLMLTVSVLFCSRFGQNEMAAVTLAQAWLSLVCFVPAVGLMTVCSTYFSVGHGANLGRSQGIYLQKMVYLSIIASLICSAILIQVDYFVLILNKEPDVIILVDIFVRTFIPGTLAAFLTFGLSRTLQCRNKMAVTAVAATIGLGSDVLLNYMLVYVLDMGFRGSAIAVVVAQYINCIILAVYVYKYEDLEFFSLKSLENWGEFFSIAVHGCLNLEIMQFAIVISYILAGQFGTLGIAVVGAFDILALYVYLLLMGLSSSVTILVGQYLGKNDVKNVKITVKAAFIFLFGVAVVVGLPLLLLRDYAGYIYTDDSEIIATFSKIIPLSVVMVFSVTIEGINKAILKAIGRQNIGTVTSLISHSCGLALSVLFAFKLDWKAIGLCAGIIFGTVIEACILLVVLMNIDFTQEAELALERCRVSEEEYSEIVDDVTNGMQLNSVQSKEKLQSDGEEESRSLIANTKYRLSKTTIIIRTLNFTIPIFIFLSSLFIYLF
ncbi:multidrug and toxin extrusion protein 1-like isoform X1 [Antedon mediterranea]|uniref:multidrug and toxin extrusion protein 1-like isoform X1 n=1 Tax=Antedon mediterranea TaxID=105859 RepID=UPI003AF71338